jgi:hypothetical protein
MAKEEAKTAGPQVGAPLVDFEAAVDTLHRLQREGTYQIFLAGESRARLVGDTDAFRVSLASNLGSGPIETKRVDKLLDEVQAVLQVLLATQDGAGAARLLEEAVYDDEFEAAKEDQEASKKLREIVTKKVEIVGEKLRSEAMRERMKRLSTTVGPLLQDVDFDLVSQRHSSTGNKDISSPFLRLTLRYSVGSKTQWPFLPPPWATNLPVATEALEFDCDETDIDLLVTRLLQAKEFLKKAIEATVESKKP